MWSPGCGTGAWWEEPPQAQVGQVRCQCWNGASCTRSPKGAAVNLDGAIRARTTNVPSELGLLPRDFWHWSCTQPNSFNVIEKCPQEQAALSLFSPQRSRGESQEPYPHTHSITSGSLTTGRCSRHHPCPNYLSPGLLHRPGLAPLHPTHTCQPLSFILSPSCSKTPKSCQSRPRLSRL